MSHAAPPDERRRAQEERLLRTWQSPTGWRYWSDVNNSRVGVWYTAAATFGFLIFGGVLALLMRIQLATPGNDFLSAERYNQVFTVHGSVMMFLFAIPIFEAIAVLLLPQMTGARPSISAAFCVWLLGVSDRRSVPLRIDLLQRRSGGRLVHVSAADVGLPA